MSLGSHSIGYPKKDDAKRRMTLRKSAVNVPKLSNKNLA